MSIPRELQKIEGAYPFRSIGILQIPHQDNWVRIVGNRRNELRLFSRMPCHGADRFPSEVIKRQGFPLRLDVPHCEESSTSTSHQDMRNLLVPIQAIEIVSASRLVAEPVGVFDISEVPNVKLPRCQRSSDNNLRTSVPLPERLPSQEY